MFVLILHNTCILQFHAEIPYVAHKLSGLPFLTHHVRDSFYVNKQSKSVLFALHLTSHDLDLNVFTVNTSKMIQGGTSKLSNLHFVM